jgi:hypothetical protein
LRAGLGCACRHRAWRVTAPRWGVTIVAARDGLQASGFADLIYGEYPCDQVRLLSLEAGLLLLGEDVDLGEVERGLDGGVAELGERVVGDAFLDKVDLRNHGGAPEYSL